MYLSRTFFIIKDNREFISNTHINYYIGKQQANEKCKICDRSSPLSSKHVKKINWIKCDRCGGWYHM